MPPKEKILKIRAFKQRTDKNALVIRAVKLYNEFINHTECSL